MAEAVSKRACQCITCGSTRVKTFGMFPTKGSEVGGTPVAVALEMDASEVARNRSEMFRGFDPSMLYCKFGSTTPQSMIRGQDADAYLDELVSVANQTNNIFFHKNSGLLVCIAPPFPLSGAIPGPVPFSITCGDEEKEDIPEPAMSFEYTIASRVQSINPSLGGPGTKVSVQGSGFKNSSLLTCLFGEHGKAEAQFISNDLVLCIAPDQEDGQYLLSVSNNGIDLERELGGITFSYVPLPVVLGVQPQTITWSMNATVSVTGRHFTPDSRAFALCSFEFFGKNTFSSYATSAALASSEELIFCAVPRRQDIADQGMLNVRVSTNGVDFSTSSSRVFIYQGPVLLLSALPDAAKVSRGGDIVVYGENFRPSHSLACWFHLDGDDDFISVHSTYISSSKIECPCPQTRSGRAQLWVSTNGEMSGRSTNSLDFQFLDAMSLTAIAPSIGSVLGGTSVIVHGTGFDSHSPTVCRFGAADVMASVLNSTSICCISPPAATALEGPSFDNWGSHSSSYNATVPLDVSLDGRVFTASGINFEYLSLVPSIPESPNTSHLLKGNHMTLTKLYPPGGSELGGTQVEIQGSNFIRTGLKCMFNGIESSITRWITSCRLICTAPLAAFATIVNVTLAMGGESLATDGLQFVYLPASRIASFNPMFGSSEGGTSIHVHGIGFQPIEGVLPKCLFPGSKNPSVVATILSRTLIKCEIPPANSNNSTMVALSFNGGADLVLTDKVFTYVSMVTIKSIYPTAYLSSAGGTEVIVEGDNFVPDDKLNGVAWRCSFGDTVVVATVLTSDTIACFAPPMAPGPVKIRVSINGVDFSASAAKAIYHNPAEIHEVTSLFVPEMRGDMVVVKGANFQPSHDLSCIFSTSCHTHISPAMFVSESRVTCHVPSSVIMMALERMFVSESRVTCHVPSTVILMALEISNSNESNPDNPSVLYHPTLSKSSNNPHTDLSGNNKTIFETRGIKTPPAPIKLLELTKILVRSVEPTIISETGGSIISVVSSGLEIKESQFVTSCIFSAINSQGNLMSLRLASVATNYVSAKFDGKFDSNIIACQAPRLSPGKYLLSLELSNGHLRKNVPEIARVVVHSAFSLHSFAPLSGPSSGGTKMTIRGSSFPFPNTTKLSCKVGASIVQVQFHSQEEIMCTIPPIDGNSSTHISVSANGHDFHKVEGMMFSYTARPHLLEIIPFAGKRGISLIIRGDNLLPKYTDREIIVGFGNVIVSGVSLNETALTCIAPPLEHNSEIPVRISTNGGYDFSNILSFTYHNKLYISHIVPSFGPERGGNSVTIVGGGFPAGQAGLAGSKSGECLFGDTSSPVHFISQQSIQCIVPRSVAYSVVDVAFTFDGVNIASSPQAYKYLPMLQVYDVKPPALPTNVPHEVHVTGKNFGQYPSGLMCKLGAMVSSKAVVTSKSSLSCFTSPIFQPGEQTLDIVTEVGDSVLESESFSNTTIKFYEPIDFHIQPAFGRMRGGTIIKAFLDGSFSVGVDLPMMCRFSLNNASIDVVAIPLNSTVVSCQTPNVEGVWPNDGNRLHTSISLILPRKGLPVSLSFPFIFKALPSVQSIRPSVGRGNTRVRVTGDGAGLWLNSTELTCYFGKKKGKAMWIGPLEIDCISPSYSHDNSGVILTVSDNGGVDLASSQSVFAFHDDPFVMSVEPHIGMTHYNSTVKFIGKGFMHHYDPVCIFEKKDIRSVEKAILVKGTVVNDTFMECHVMSNMLPPSEYVCSASKNGVAHGHIIRSSGPRYVSMHAPAIVSLSPQFGIESIPVLVTVTGQGTAIEDLDHVRCILWKLSSSIGSSHAERTDITSVQCNVQCPVQNTTTKYFLGISLGGTEQAVNSFSKHLFWCYPKPKILGWTPKEILVGEKTTMRINIEGLPAFVSIDCLFRGVSHIEAMPAIILSGSMFECHTPVFDHAQQVILSVRLNNHTTLNDELQIEVIDEIAVYSISPKAIFVGSDVLIKGKNFAPGKINCNIGGMEGNIVRSSKSYCVCRSPAHLKAFVSVEVNITFKEAPHVNATAGFIKIYPAPTVDHITPSTGLAQGGTHVIVQGRHFRAIGGSSCRFGTLSSRAYVLSENMISCFSPAGKAGKVQVQLSLDSGLTFHEAKPFSFFTPILLKEVYPNVVINGTTLLLKGENFQYDLPIKCCVKGIHQKCSFSPGTVLSSTEGTCQFPSTRIFGDVDISIATSDNILASVGMGRVIHQPLVKIDSLSPLYGSVIGGEVIKLQLSGILNDIMQDSLGPVHCLFGSKTVMANAVGDSVISCLAPEADSIGNVSLSLLYDGMPFTSHALIFEYTYEFKVYNISPSLGPFSGGTIVRVNGLNLMPQSKVLCRFGHYETHGYVKTDGNYVNCITPSFNQITRQTLYLKLDGGDWLDTGMDFHFLEPITVENLSPLEINSDVDFIRVKGRGFLRTANMTCRFGQGGQQTITEAVLVSNNTMNCPFPWGLVKYFGRQIPLSVTSNGIDFTSSTSLLILKEEGQVSIGELSPTLGPAFGSSKIRMRLDGFRHIALEHANLTCWFGNLASRAAYLADGNIQCISSPIFIKDSERVLLSNVSITLGDNIALRASARSKKFVYYSHPPNLGIQPTHGVIGGGTEIRLGGDTMSDVLRKLSALNVKTKPTCRFEGRSNTVDVRATVSAEGLVCISPGLKETGDSTTKAVQVLLSLNGEDFVIAQTFHYYHSSIHSISPETVWVNSHTEMIVRGSNFIPNLKNEVTCLVGYVEIQAEVVSESVIRCTISLNQTYSNQILPVSVSFNGQDVSNTVPVICQAHMPMVTSATPMFVSDAGGTLVELEGHGFEHIRSSGSIAFTGRDQVATLTVVDNERASFVVPSSNGHNSANILLSVGGGSYSETGFEIQYLQHLHISSVNPRFITDNKETQARVFGDFNQNLTYYCVLFGDANDKLLESVALYRNETTLACDISDTSQDISTAKNRRMRLAIWRGEDNRISNALNIFYSPLYAIDFIEPSIVAEAEAGFGGYLLSVMSPKEVPFSCRDQLQCRFIDETGSAVIRMAEFVTADMVRCLAPPLRGDTEVSLAREGLSQSNRVRLSVRPTSQIVQLEPDSGPLSGGTYIKVHGTGFATYAVTKVICKFDKLSSSAEVFDDETIFCTAPSSKFASNITFVLAQPSIPELVISNSFSYQYYLQPKLVMCTPDNGPASGGTKITCQGEGFTGIESSFKLSFRQISDPSHVTYSKDLKILSESVLVVISPPAPNGSKGGMGTIQLSRNEQDLSSSGLYYNYTKSAFITHYNPQQVVESSCFNLSLLVENLMSLPLQCFIDHLKFPALHDGGAVTCNICLNLNEGYHRVGLLMERGIFIQAKSRLEIRRFIHVTRIAPSIGPSGGGTVLTVEGEDFGAWNCQLYCFFDADPSLAKVLNDTVLQCIVPVSPKEKSLAVAVHVAPYHQSIRNFDNFTVHYKYYEPESIVSFAPRSGPVGGGGILLISGSNFIDTPSLSCMFGVVPTQALYISEQKIECQVPSLADAMLDKIPIKRMSLMVSNNAVDFISAGTYIFHNIPEVTNMSPVVGPAFTKVTFSIKSCLGWVENVRCRFGESFSSHPSAYISSDHEIVCISPPVTNQVNDLIVTVQISFNGFDFFGDGMTFQYSNQPWIFPTNHFDELVAHGKSLAAETDYVIESSVISKHSDHYRYYYLPPIIISSVSPTHGSLRGGTLVSLHVDGVPADVENLYCIFGTSIATAEFINRTIIGCPTPPSNTSRVVSVGLAQDRELTELSPVADFFFRYTNVPVIYKVIPRRGPIAGGTIVSLQGNNLLPPDNKETVRCKFGHQTSPALFVSNEEVKCIAPQGDVVREIQAVRIIGSNTLPLLGSFALGFKHGVTASIDANSSAEEMRKEISLLPGIDDILVTVEPDSMNLVRKSFLITFSGLVNEDQPLMTIKKVGILGHSSVFVERIQSLCCEVSLTVNGIDYFGAENRAPLNFIYDERVLVTNIVPNHGSISGGTVVKLSVTGISPSSAFDQYGDCLKNYCLFGTQQVEGNWVDERTIACTTPGRLWGTRVAVGIKTGDVRSESMATYVFHSDPVVTSIIPELLPAFGMSTTSINLHGYGFQNFSMSCIFSISLSLKASAPHNHQNVHRQPVHRQQAIFYNHSCIQCPYPPKMQSFFSQTEQSWTTNSTLIEDSVIEISLETGTDLHIIGTIHFHAVVKETSIFPRTGPRAGATEVVVEGENFMNSTSLTCKFGPVLGLSAQYLSPSKVVCVTPHFSPGYGRVAVPVQIAVNGIDFSTAPNNVHFEYHEPLVIKQVMPLIGLPKGGTTVNVNLDNIIMRLSATPLDYENHIKISYVDPPYGPEIGGNIVTVYGIGFTPEQYTTCHFGGMKMEVPAWFLSDKSIQCIAPTFAGETIVNVGVSVNGIDQASTRPNMYTFLPSLS